MTYNITHEKHLNWLREQHMRLESESTLGTIPSANLKSRAAYYKLAIDIFSLLIEVSPHEQAIFRNPKETLRSEFKAMTLGQAAEYCLNHSYQPLSAKDLAELLFESRSKDEHIRATNSLSTELRRGALLGRWKKVKRGFFACKNNTDI